MEAVIRVKNLVKKYGSFTALNNISFTVFEKEVYGILGPNGAGKTTLFKILSGISVLTNGYLEVLNRKTIDNNMRNYIAYTPQNPTVYEELTGHDNLLFYLRLYGLDGYTAEEKIKEIVGITGLKEYVNKYVKTYSGGMKKRLNIAIALASNPKILILDEPTAGLDPNIRRDIWSLIIGLRKKGVTILLATHYMDEAETLCDRVAIIDKGRIIDEGTPHELKEKYGLKSSLNILVSGSAEEARDILVDKLRIHDINVIDNHIRIYIDDPRSKSPEILNILFKYGYNVMKMEIFPPTLEDVFMKLTGRRLEE